MSAAARAVWSIIYFGVPAAMVAWLWTAVPASLALQPRLGMTLGTVAFCLYCLQILSTSRIRPVERPWGQDRLYRYHVYLGAAVLLLALLHASTVGHGAGSADQKWFGEKGRLIAVFAGGVSVFFLTSLFVARVPLLMRARRWCDARFPFGYQFFIWLHYGMLVALVFLWAHVALLPIPELLGFRVAMSALCAVSFGLFFWHRLVRPRLLDARDWTVREARAESDDVTGLTLAPAAGTVPRFDPGQFLFLTPRNDNAKQEEHPFTIASSPLQRDRLEVCIKNVGDFSASVRELQPGDPVRVHAPLGRFSYRLLAPAGGSGGGSGPPLVFVAGGIGVTPFLSMLRTLAAEEPDRPVTLLWACRRSTDLIRHYELTRLADAMASFTYMPTLTRDDAWPSRHGRIDAEMLRRVRDSAGPEAHWFVCGPPPMAIMVTRELKSLHIATKRVHNERFGY